MLNSATNKVKKVLFNKPTQAFFLTDNTRLEFLSEVNTDSIPTDLMRAFPLFAVEMDFNSNINRKSTILYNLSSDDAFLQIKKLLWVVGVVLNVLLIATYQRDAVDETIEESSKVAATVLALVVLVVAAVFLVVWMLVRLRLRLKIAIILESDEGIDSKGLSVRAIFNWIAYVWFFLSKEVILLILLTVIASNLLGLFLHPFFYSLQLLTILALSKTANYVVKAITIHFDQFLVTLLLAVVVMYCYSFFTFTYYWDLLQANQSGSEDP